VLDYILKTSPYNTTFDELMVENLNLPQTEPRIQLDRVVETGGYTFVLYGIRGFGEKDEKSMAFWSSEDKVFYPNAIVSDPDNESLNIDSRSQIFSGYDGRSLIVAVNAFELQDSKLPFEVRESDNDILVRYILR
jgi:hypothetical protein